MSGMSTLRPKQNGWHVPDLQINFSSSILIKIWPKFVPKDSIENMSSLVQVMACIGYAKR